jgi:tRNA threonylcarbamoyladenosine biosynthesis protein TsaE
LRQPGPLTLSLADEAATRAAGARLALAWARAPATLFVALEGELGAGKTTFVRGFLAALGEAGPVRSPTYGLLESYSLAHGRRVHHLDWYRLAGAVEEVDALGFRELLAGHDACLVEWADRVPSLAARADVRIRLALAKAGRTLQGIGQSRLGERLAACLPSPEKA